MLSESYSAERQENIFKHNQRRIASIKSLGELYMHRVLNATIIFDTLWMLISFGHRECTLSAGCSLAAQGLPVPGRDSPIDAVDDFFRIRLVCTLLDTCGTTFSKGGQKKRLDQFLMIFQVSLLFDIPLSSSCISCVRTKSRWMSTLCLMILSR